MKKIFSLCLLLAFLICFNKSTAQAITIDFVPVTQTVLLGTSVDVDLVISGLGDLAAPSLGAFDLDVGFDSTILSLDTTDADVDFVIDSVVLDPTDQLDVLGLGGNFVGAEVLFPGVLSMFEVSLDLSSDLDNFQAGSFTLATLSFDTLSVGTSSLGVAIYGLSDAWAVSLGVDAFDFSNIIINTGEITVTAAAVPEPSTLLLLGSGLFGLVVMRKKFRV